MEIRIQPIGNEHSAAAIDLILNIQQKEFNVPITIDDQPDLLQIEAFYYQGGGAFWGAFHNDELVGTIALIRYADQEGAIRKMFVKKEFRGKEYGIAQQLLDILITYCRENGIRDLYLGTIAILEAALRFYEKNNFVRIEKTNLPDAFPLMSADNVFCHLNLDKQP
ncbi:GNAT family N-acetyltransferase [Flavobacterium supellecticarium]|uniref:GNAT family N-acetyltransferase n=1 Tax=Flavobacterium supellecticarium TaxID=2565924 RepID=A0A4S4A4B1_9FLAO|nr:GNAT family N-acetyltransferase [Flavobacterium supellecticarium]THF52795.1 GNAT family N-acetyltransferase [Flavobacterium supellecticarium]